MRRVVLITGPPCAGKTTYARAHAQPGDLVLDQDAMGRTAMRQALDRLPRHDGTAWVIRCAAGPRARAALAQRIGATEHVHLVEPEHVLVRRAAQRPHPRRHIAAVAAWFEQERRNPAPRVPQPRGRTTQRGYGYAHQKARERAIRDLVDGTPCPRCSRPMWRAEARLLDLDHTEDRRAYQGLAHASCNRRAGQAKAVRQRRAAVAAAEPPRARSRQW